jgi:transposase
MLSKDGTARREQIQYASVEDLVASDHILRGIEKAVDFSFIYDKVSDRYSAERGRPSIDPVILIKIVLIQYMFGIRSMRQTCEDIKYNVAYRWFLGLDLYDPVPHFSTFGKNYSRRFEGTELFEQIFMEVLFACKRAGYVKEETVYIDATHIKARANRNKKHKTSIPKEAMKYMAELTKEINRDRVEHGKEPFDDNDGDGPPPTETKEIIQSQTDPESGLFVKGEHERQFAYSVQAASDENGWILGYEVYSGNTHDSVSFEDFYEKLDKRGIETIVMDAGYKVPYIARQLIKDEISPLFPGVAPKTKDSFFKKYDYVYDEFLDAFICPNLKLLEYSTTNREGYREYKSKGYQCKKCPHLDKCTRSRNCTKVVTRHVWQDYMEQAEDVRYTIGMKEVYARRKETIERVFADAKEKHGMRYTQYKGRAKVRMQVGLTLACMNLKKLVRMMKNHPAPKLSAFVFAPFFSLLLQNRKPLRFFA